MIKKFLLTSWSAALPVVTIFSLFLVAGMGFGFGVYHSEAYKTLLDGRAIIVTSIKLETQKND